MIEPAVHRGWTQHAVDRAWQRYRVPYDAADWRTLVLDIIAARAGEPSDALFVGYDPSYPGTLVYRARLSGIDVRAAWDCETGCIVTILPLTTGEGRPVINKSANTPGRTRRARIRAEEWD